MEELVFVYGTLKDLEVQKQVIGRVVQGTPVNLPGYCKSSIGVNDHNYFIIIAHPFSFVSGKVIKVSPGN